MKIIKENTKGENKHLKELGFSTPKDYFKNSKSNILAEIEAENTFNERKISENKFVWIAIAASVVVLLSITIFNKSIFGSIDNPQIVSDTLNQIKKDIHTEENLVLLDENDLTITSLFIEDNEIDELVEQQLVEDILKENNLN